MNSKKDGKGWATFVAGAGIICYALIILVVSLLSTTKFHFGHLCLFGLSLTMIVLAIGLLKHNYYAWLLRKERQNV